MSEMDFGPELLKQFKLRGKLGEGGMSQVYLAEQLGLGRLVALKFLAASSFPEQESLERFRREGQALAVLNHENILSIYGTGVDRNRPYLVLEYLPGETLRDALNTRRAYAPDEAARIVLCVARALEYAHRHGVIHRDIKPENVFITRDGEVRVFDFGLAKLAQSANLNLTEKGIILGTPSYIAPEQVTGSPPSKSTDIYGVGALLYELLTGHAPHGEGHDLKFLRRKVKEDPTPITDRIPGLDPSLAAVVTLSLKRNPRERHPTMAHLVLELSSFLGLTPPPMPSRSFSKLPSPIARAARSTRRSWMVGLAAGAAVLFLLLIATLVLGRWGPTGPDVRDVSITAATHGLVVAWGSWASYRGMAEARPRFGPGDAVTRREGKPGARHRIVIAPLEPDRSYHIRVGHLDGGFLHLEAVTPASLGVPPSVTLERLASLDEARIRFSLAAPAALTARSGDPGLAVTVEGGGGTARKDHHLTVLGPGAALGEFDLDLRLVEADGASEGHRIRVEGLIREVRRFEERPDFYGWCARAVAGDLRPDGPPGPLADLRRFLDLQAPALREGLRRQAIPLPTRYRLYDALTQVARMERAASVVPLPGPALIPDLLGPFAAGGARSESAPPVPADVVVLREYTRVDNNILLEGQDPAWARRSLQELGGPDEDVFPEARFETELPVVDRERLTLGVETRCIGRDRFLRLVLNDEYTLVLWGAGENLEDPVQDLLDGNTLDASTPDRLMPHQTLTLTVPAGLFRAGLNRFVLTAHPIGRRVREDLAKPCIPSVNRVWIRYH